MAWQVVSVYIVPIGTYVACIKIHIAKLVLIAVKWEQKRKNVLSTVLLSFKSFDYLLYITYSNAQKVMAVNFWIIACFLYDTSINKFFHLHFRFIFRIKNQITVASDGWIYTEDISFFYELHTAILN